MANRNPNSANQPAVSVRKEKQTNNPGCLVAFGLLFAVIGCVASYFLVVRPLLNINAAQRWIETPCVIVSSKVGVHRSSKGGSTFSVDIVYDYEFNQQNFRSERYDFAIGSSGGLHSKQQIVDRFPAGKKAVCYVNPQLPSQAVISRDLPIGFWFGMIPAAFVVIGMILAGIGFGLARKRKNAQMDVPQSNFVTPSSDSTNNLLTDRFSREPVTLKPESTAGMKLLIAIVLAVFWNGIVSVFLGVLIFDPPPGFMRWGLGLFLTPFVLVGLALIYAVFHAFLALFNPRPTLTVSGTLIQLGFPLSVSWQFSGRATSIQRLKIFLEGKEEATYRRGTSTYTDRSVFAELSIVDTTNFSEIPQGQAEVTIPFNTMHSWDGGHNKIVWTLRVVGEIKFWPDVDDTYPIQVSAVVLE